MPLRRLLQRPNPTGAGRAGGLALCALVSLAVVPLAAVPPQFTTLTIVAPGSRGGGWDQTARAMQRTLETEGLVERVVVLNSPGAGGAIGLAQFISDRRGEGDALLVGGLFMVGALRTQRATVSLADATPIARVTGEYEVVAVPAGSELRGLDDLVQALRVSPGAVSWAGGSGGGTDQMLIHRFAGAIGVEPVRMNYVPFAGGGEVADALLDNQVGVAVSGLAEFAPHLASGRIRALGISSPTRLEGVAIPTLREQGVEVALVNWRGLFAPPGLDDAEQERLSGLVDTMVETPSWRRELREAHWSDLYLPPTEFAAFVAGEQARAEAAPDPRGTRSASRPGAVWTGGMWLLRHLFGIALATALVVAVAVLALGWQQRRGRRRERELSASLAAAREDLRQRSAEAAARLADFSDQIEKQFGAWGLTAAEREVAWLMLKGLRHKEVAAIRGTSERTVRQQALTIYKKAGLDGRTDLAAFFLEDLLAATPSDAPSSRTA